MHITIIGAGPVGSYLAWQHAKKGRDVRLIEEHQTIGAPVQCTGILTQDILTHLPKKLVKEHTLHTVNETVVHGPHTSATIPLQDNYVIDNTTYCQALAGKAHDEGARIKTSTRYLRNDAKSITLKDLQHQDQIDTTTDLLIGADGPTSNVAKHNNLYGERTFLTGVQAIKNVKDYDERIHFYPAIGEYAWYCPQGDGKARIGVAARNGAKQLFDDFIKRYEGTIERMQGGPLPLYKPRQPVERSYGQMHVQLIGDAALHIKNTTGGGIVPGTKAASIHAQDPNTYANNLGPLSRELKTHYHINKAMRKFSQKDWDKLITQANDERVKELLKRKSRDQALPLATRLILAKPQLLLWARKLL